MSENVINFHEMSNEPTQVHLPVTLPIANGSLRLIKALRCQI